MDKTRGKKYSSIFIKVIRSILLPEILVFSTIAFFSYAHLSSVFKEEQKSHIDHVKHEIQSLAHITTTNLQVIENTMQRKTERMAFKIIFDNIDTIQRLERLDLDEYKKNYGLGIFENDDIYIINKEGVIVNTTFKKDLGMNLKEFGPEQAEFLESIIEDQQFRSDPFSIEISTGKFKKYSYMPTPGGEYIVEIGMYSELADELQVHLTERYEEITRKNKNIESIDIFIGSMKPTSILYDFVAVDDADIIKEVFKTSNEKQVLINDTLECTYTMLHVPNSGYDQVAKLQYNTAYQQRVLKSELVRDILLFGLGLGLLAIILLFSIRKITRPIYELIRGIKEFGDGDMKSRVKAYGTSETFTLANRFNQMAEDLEIAQSDLILQREIVQEKNTEILDSITYAKNIQTAILPPLAKFADNLKDGFILYEPKDIVAGDFYWCEIVDDKMIFAVADCTGHGVPGAMVSVVCHTALNRCVREYGLQKPSEILDKAKELVIETLHAEEHESDNIIRDGMDICLVSLDRKNLKLEFAGANNPLFIIRNKELIKFEADHQPIGLFYKNVPFTNQEVDLEVDDILYLFTDGYQDQFGGTKGKKLKGKAFKNKLVEAHLMEPMNDQRDFLLEYLIEWEGEYERIDDICIIGVKI